MGSGRGVDRRCFRCGAALYRSGECENPECAPVDAGAFATREVPLVPHLVEGSRPVTRHLPRVRRGSSPEGAREIADEAAVVAEGAASLDGPASGETTAVAPPTTRRPVRKPTLPMGSPAAPVALTVTPSRSASPEYARLERGLLVALRERDAAHAEARRWRRIASVLGVGLVLALAVAAAVYGS